MRKIFLCIQLVWSIAAFSQGEKETSGIIFAKFERLYNAGSFDSVFYLFSVEMKNALPLEKTSAFFKGLHDQAGQITNRRFIKYVTTYASYKTKFERGLYSVNISVDKDSNINGIYVEPYTDKSLPKMERNLTQLKLPFKGEWTVTWGGDTKELNYHVESQAQKNAFDILISNEQQLSYRTDGKNNEDYYAFGQPLVAPCDGVIVLSVDGVKDNVPGVLNPAYPFGNSIILRTGKNEFLVFAHFKQHSIRVKQGQHVKQGQLLGLCGNSGNSSEPHLHFHIQNTEDINAATGVKCFFEHIIVNGQVKKDYSPIRKDKIRQQ